MDNLMGLVFMSNHCHRTCSHCYWPNPSTEKMSLQVAQDVAEWFANICLEENVKNLNISFLGGEPTNNIEGVFRFIDSFDRASQRLQLPIQTRAFCQQLQAETGLHWRLFTNGDLLTEEMLRSIKKRHVLIMLNPTYDPLEEIERKILFIKGICGGCDMGIALNETNLPRLEDLTRLALKHHCHIRPNQLYNGGAIPGYVEEYTEQMKKMFKILLEADYPMWPNWILQSTFPTWTRPENPYSCGKRNPVIDTDGSIRSCNPDAETKIGSIYTHPHWKDLKFIYNRWSAKNLPECRGCEWITICQGGCPYIRKMAYGTYDHKSPFCEAFKELFPLLMQLKERWCEKYSNQRSDTHPDPTVQLTV